MTALLNPLCTLDELKMQLKFSLTDTSKDEELTKAINNASRWVEKYTGRQFRLFDYTTDPLVIDEFDGIALAETVFLPQRRVISISSVVLGGEVLEEDVDYVVKEDSGKLIRIGGGEWNLSRPDNTLEVYGLLGWRQPLVVDVTEAGDTGNALTNWSIRDTSDDGHDIFYWALTDLGSSMFRVELFSDEAHSNRVAYGTGTAPGDVELDEDNSSGVYGSVTVAAGAATDDDAGNTLTPSGTRVDTTEMPDDLPSNINQACRIVAAVFSGHHTKEISGLDGLKQTVKSSEIPKDVYGMLGRQAPVLV